MLHLENEALMHGRLLHEAADHARLVAEARGPRQERPSLFSLLAGPLFHRRTAAADRPTQPVQTPRISTRMTKQQDAV